MRRIRAVGVIAKEELEQLQAANAEAEVSSTAEEDPVEDLDEHAESAETEMLDADETEAEAEAESDDVDDAMEATEALESVLIVLESRKDKGLSQAEAQMMNIALAGAYRKAGFSSVKVYSPESYTDQKRVTTTRLAMEEIQVNLKEVWAKAKEAIMRFWEQVKAWFVKVFTALGQYKERAQKILAAEAKLEGVAKASELDKPALAKALHISGQVDVGRALTTLEGATSSVLNDQKAVVAMAKSASSADAEGAKKAVEATLGKLGKGVGNPKAEGFDRQFVSRSDELPGGFAIVAMWNNMSDVKIGLSAYKPSAPEFEGKSVAVLTKDQIKAVGTGVIKLCDALKQLEGELKAADAEAKTLTGAIDSLYQGGESNPADKEKVKTLTKLAQSVLAEPGRSFVGYAARTVKALLDVAELSIREFGEKAAALPGPTDKPAPAAEPAPAA